MMKMRVAGKHSLIEHTLFDSLMNLNSRLDE